MTVFTTDFADTGDIPRLVGETTTRLTTEDRERIVGEATENLKPYVDGLAQPRRPDVTGELPALRDVPLGLSPADLAGPQKPVPIPTPPKPGRDERLLGGWSDVTGELSEMPLPRPVPPSMPPPPRPRPRGWWARRRYQGAHRRGGEGGNR